MSNCFTEVLGLKRLGLYINKDVVFTRPDISKPNEINLIAHATGSIVIEDENELPRWERELNYSGNYKINYLDTISFFLHGIENNTPQILELLRNERNGYIVEIITRGNKSYVFQAPMFLNEANTKQINSHSFNISMSYRVPTFKNYLTKLNTILMTNSYIIVGDEKVLGKSTDIAVVSS